MEQTEYPWIDESSLKTPEEVYQPEEEVIVQVEDKEDLKKRTQMGDDRALAMRLTMAKHINVGTPKRND